MQFTTLDGKSFTAATYGEAVDILHHDTKMNVKDRTDFMVQVSKSSWEYNGSNIRTDTDEHFILDLMEGGFLVLS